MSQIHPKQTDYTLLTQRHPSNLIVHCLLYNYLTSHPSASIEIHSCEWAWLRSRLWTEIKRIITMEEPPEIPKVEMDSKAAMWAHIQRDYTLSNHPSYIACSPPDGNKPPPMIRATIAHHNCLICFTIFHFTVAHCFDADYSNHFHRRANDTTACPCNQTHPLPPHRTLCCHTHHYSIFHCPLSLMARAYHI